MILEVVLEIAVKRSKDKEWLLFYEDLAKAFKYVAVITAFLYIWPIVSMLAHICFMKGEDAPRRNQAKAAQQNLE